MSFCESGGGNRSSANTAVEVGTEGKRLIVNGTEGKARSTACSELYVFPTVGAPR